jgi:hypothetical protein
MTTRFDQRPGEPRQVGRRAVTRGAAWSIPVISLAVAAPSMAASGCVMKTGQLSWDVFGDGTSQTGNALATTGGTGVTVTISVAGDTGATGNGVVTSALTGGLSQVMRFTSLNNVTDTSQTVTITFNKPVQNLTFSLLDIDSATGGYNDQVIINTPGYTGTTHKNLVGTGSATGNGNGNGPYRPQNGDSPVDGSSPNGNVDLAWTGPVSSVSFIYRQNGRMNGSPFIGISDLSFQSCT